MELETPPCPWPPWPCPPCQWVRWWWVSWAFNNEPVWRINSIAVQTGKLVFRRVNFQHWTTRLKNKKFYLQQTSSLTGVSLWQESIQQSCAPPPHYMPPFSSAGPISAPPPLLSCPISPFPSAKHCFPCQVLSGRDLQEVPEEKKIKIQQKASSI